HRVSHHGKMSDAEWEEAYRAAWHAFYTPEHMRTIMRRTAAHPLGRPQTTLSTILWFLLMILFEGVHPLEGGAFRLKFRRDRRRGLPIESPLAFYPRYAREILVKAWNYGTTYRRAKKMMKEVLAAPDRWSYTDVAIAPPREDEFDTLELYHATSGGEAALARKRRGEAIRAAAGAAHHREHAAAS
ncbi:MAG TPA: radical SAM protein, partial [Xanthobacteraceae bacterium]|nr:radical SAM protein [Xanthobacteraceae bacterium]